MTSVTRELPAPDALAETLLDLAVPHEDITELLALQGRMTTDPELRGMLESSVRELAEGIGRIDGGWDFPRPEGVAGHEPAIRRYFPVYVLLATLPYTVSHHRERAVPDAVSRRTLADLGRHMALHRRRHGTGGLLKPGWLGLHFRGELYQVGRLQYQRARLGERLGGALREAGEPYGPGDLSLSLHIPDFLGPLTPEACDRSLAGAADLFARCFPEESFAVAECHSWLLDPQLARYLPADSNIVRFQRRFRTRCDETAPADEQPIEFVFGDPALWLDELPRRTTLERAVGDHLRAGGHWYCGHGWFPM